MKEPTPKPSVHPEELFVRYVPEDSIGGKSEEFFGSREPPRWGGPMAVYRFVKKVHVEWKPTLTDCP
jgi:hypothetical protein